ncbi:MAG: PAS domain-containing sensor histidine kinase [Pseudomonadota bacterium]
MAPHSERPRHGLRERAEDLIHAKASPTPTHLQELSAEAMRHMLHELQVHQVELEMQNDELRQTQAALDAARARYFDLYDLAPVGYCTISEQGLVLEVNFTAAALLNMARSDVVNKPMSSLIARSDQDTYYTCRKALFESGLPQGCELQLVRRDSAVFWAHVQISLAHEADHAPVQRLVLTDISARKAMDAILLEKNQALQVAQAVAEKASLAKSDFLSNMSHELRSPLNAILGFAQLMDLGDPAPTATQKSSIDRILRAGWYLLDLIGEILDLTAIESGRLQLQSEPVALCEVLTSSQASVAPAAQARNIRMVCEQPHGALKVSADKSRLHQVLVHLLSNAIQYNRTGGTVEVSCSVQADQRIRVSVIDGGYGLSADKISHLFQPFNRLGRDSGSDEGTGVGLALSKRLVELMGGTISARSTIGVGSVFWIELAHAGTPEQSLP